MAESELFQLKLYCDMTDLEFQAELISTCTIRNVVHFSLWAKENIRKKNQRGKKITCVQKIVYFGTEQYL